MSASVSRISLSLALRRHWTHLIGVTIFPFLFFLGWAYGVPNWVSIVGLILVVGHAAWPYFRHGAPYSFWVVATLLWVLGGIAGALGMAALDLLPT